MKSMQRGTWIVAAVAAGLLAGAARAVEPIPDWITLVFPTMVPKSGNPNTVPAALERNFIEYAYQTRYESFWKETSYYRDDLATGAKLWGAYGNTKTYGFVQMPWPLANRPSRGAFARGSGMADSFNPETDEGANADAAVNQASGTVGTPNRRYSLSAFNSRFYSFFYDTADTDLVWSPGESFNDADNDGQWDPPQPGEDYWDSDNTVAFVGDPNAYQPRNNWDEWSQYGGEMFVDFNDNNGFNRILTIYYANGGAQVALPGHNELDISPDNGTIGSNEGDFNHIIVTNVAIPMPYAINPFPIPGSLVDGVTIPQNAYLDATTDADGNLQVVDTGLYIEYGAYCTTNAAAETRGYYIWNEVWKGAGAPPATTQLRTVRASIFAARELYGTYKSGATATPGSGIRIYGDLRGAVAPTAQNPARRITNANDGQPTDPINGETFEDFLTVYDPARGAQTFIQIPAALAGNASYERGNRLQNGSINTRGRSISFTYDYYTNYLAWNYPGQWTSMVARTYNGRFDGPDDWADQGSSGKWVWDARAAPVSGALEPTPAAVDPFSGGLIWPSMNPGGGWDPRSGYATWGDWYTAVFSAGATPAPAYPGGVTRITRYTPSNARAANGWIPESTWTFDCQAEYCDMPSSIYHLNGDYLNGETLIWQSGGADDPLTQYTWTNTVYIAGGDRRLGEVTSPWNEAIWGHDIEGAAGWYGPGDNVTPAAGPYSFNTLGGQGYDGANMMSLEFVSHRRTGVPGVDIHPPSLRDTNLDGYLDGGRELQGEANYATDTPAPGVFSWHRYMEDVIALWDQSENFAQVQGTTSMQYMYGYPIYPTAPGAEGWAALGGPSGQVRPFISRDTNVTLAITFQVRPLNGGGEAGGVGPGGVYDPNWDPNTAPAAQDFGMALLSHEQGHDLMGWPDLYDYDVWSGGNPMINTPIAAYDLMAGGGLVHGMPDLKAAAGVGGPWVTMNDLTSMLPLDGGSLMIEMYPIERRNNQYFQIANPANPAEMLNLWYTDNNTDFGVVGGRGIYVEHVDFTFFGGALPIQQKVNNHFTWELIQADGRSDLQDGINSGDTGDPFPGTRNMRAYTENTQPAARWWDASPVGIRITNIELPPTGTDGPARVTFERYSTGVGWSTDRTGADTDGDGLPDSWEFRYFGNLTSANRTSDVDLDGLTDYSEMLAGTNPTMQDTDGDGVRDNREDSDGDSLANEDEQNIHGSDPGLVDTDDDNIGDGIEVGSFTDPTVSTEPLYDRVMQLNGALTGYLEMPRVIPFGDRYVFSNLTVAAWVRPTATPAVSATIFERVVDAGKYNYRLQLMADRRLRASFSPADGSPDVFVMTSLATGIVPLNDWTHVAMSFSAATGELAVYFDGVKVAFALTPRRPQTVGPSGVDYTRAGAGFTGYMDEVAFFNGVVDVATVAGATLGLDTLGLGSMVGYFPFDDATNPAGTSGNPAWTWGQVENFAITPRQDWMNSWRNAASLRGGVLSPDVIEAPAALAAPVQAALRDSDGDGLPDWWEILRGLDPTNAGGAEGASGDPDGDGLSNQTEYEARGANASLGFDVDLPRNADANGNGMPDRLDDWDLDGLNNAYEQNTTGTRVDKSDTDDDGLPDAVEANPVPGATASSPINSWDPPTMRAMQFNGFGDSRVVVPDDPSLHLSSWSVQAWVRPAAVATWPTATGTVVRMAVYNNRFAANTITGINYEVGLTVEGAAFRPFVRFVGIRADGSLNEIRVNGLAEAGDNEVLGAQHIAALIAPEQWAQVIGSYDSVANTLRLFVNGHLVSYRTDAFAPTGLGVDDPGSFDGLLTLGAADMTAGVVTHPFVGHLDDVAVLAGSVDSEAAAQSAGQIRPPVAFSSSTKVASVPQVNVATVAASNMVPNRVIVRFKTGTAAASVPGIATAAGMTVSRSMKTMPLHVMTITDGKTVAQKIAELKLNGAVLYAEPDYVKTAFIVPNDPQFSTMWGLNNSGLAGGVADADIDAPEAWDRIRGTHSTIVAVIDSGVDYTHPDLRDNMWVNVNEIPTNGIDDDANGLVDDYHGYDYYNGDGDPMDLFGHGTHVSGTIGAVGNNGVGVVGVNWNVRIMALKVGDYFVSDSAIISSIDYAIQHGAKVINASYGGYYYSQAEYDAIARARAANILFVAAAGNDANDNDGAYPSYPASYDLPNIVSVAATDRNDAMAYFSNFGATSVDLGAPGYDILSTALGGGYETMSGTSMASPHVAGVAGLLASMYPELNCLAWKQLILGGADPIEALDGKVLSGARLNAARATGGMGTPIVHFSFNDGGTTAEDSRWASDWQNEWAHAAVIGAGAMFAVNPNLQNQMDSDADGLPDWWEIAFGMDIYSPDGFSGPTGDADGDGLENLYEYFAGTNPNNRDSDKDGTTDDNEDSDADGLSNGQEQAHGTNSGSPDTDDDGSTDSTEVANSTDPLDAYSPNRQMAYQFSGAGRLKVRTELDSDVMGDSTVEAWVRASTSGQTAILVRRAEKFPYNGVRWTDYELGVNAGYPYALFRFRLNGAAVEQIVTAPTEMVMDRWTHLAVVRDLTHDQIRLFVDGKEVARRHVAQEPPATAVGAFETVIGGGDIVGLAVTGGFIGTIDAVRVWNYTRIGLEIQDARGVLLPEFTAQGPDANRAPQRLFNFDDGGLTAENSRFTDDWRFNWAHAAEAQGPLGSAVPVMSEFPPYALDSDDDTQTDYNEHTAATSELRSEAPFVRRALRMNGASVGTVDEMVDGADTANYALTNWTVEAWVRPTALPIGQNSIVRRVTKADGYSTFELGVERVGATASPYALFTRSDAGKTAAKLASGRAIPIGAGAGDWTHIAASFDSDTGRYVLYINGGEVMRSTELGTTPYVGESGRLEIGSLGLSCDVHEMRVWKMARTGEEIAESYRKILLFTAALEQNSYQGNLAMLGRATQQSATETDAPYFYDYRTDQAFGTIPYLSGHGTYPFSVEAWVQVDPVSGAGIIAERKVRTGDNQWAICHSLRLSADGRPQGYWVGGVMVYTPVYGGQNNATLLRLDQDFQVRTTTMTSEVDIRDGTWHHLALVGDTVNVNLYIDGRLDAVRPYYVFQPIAGLPFEGYYVMNDHDGSELRIADSFGGKGGPGGTPTGGINGVFDEVMFWNDPVAQDNVRRHMKYGLTRTDILSGLQTISPIPDYAFDDGLAHHRLVSYMTFDGAIAPPFITDSARKGQQYIMLPQAAGGEVVLRSTPPIEVDRIRAYEDRMTTYLTATDGGLHVEDYMKRNDYSYAPLLGNGMTFISLGTDEWGHIQEDSDGDGLPDWWETENGLDPGSPDGVDGAGGDPDGDGLNNRAEYLAGTDPRDWDTDGDGIGDYDDNNFGPGIDPGLRKFGELYDDGDRIPDAWEANYPGIMSPLTYDAANDQDADGWSNWAEYMAQTNPENGQSYPVPALTFNVSYTGTRTAGDVVFLAYTQSEMDGIPDAQGEIDRGGAGIGVFPISGITLNVARHIREGMNRFFVFIDNDNDGAFDAGEPAGIADPTPVWIGTGAALELNVTLTDQPSGLHRFSWAAVPNVGSYRVRVETDGPSIILDKTVTATKNFIQEFDYWMAGRTALPFTSSYRWFVYTNYYGAPYAQGSFSPAYAAAIAAPVPVQPAGGLLSFARNVFSWTGDTNSPVFEISVRAGNVAGPVAFTWIATNSPRDAAGVYRFTPPVYAGEGTFTNGLYFWTVRGWNPRAGYSALSSTAAFTVSATNGVPGSSVISGRTYYTGKAMVTNWTPILVQAFASAGFNGVPESQTAVTTRTAQGQSSYTLRGLRPGTYYLRAFVDQNTNGILDTWESWGFLHTWPSGTGTYASVGLTVPPDALPGIVTIRDRDTDNDDLPDAWEYQNWQSIMTASRDTDSDGDLLTDLREYEIDPLDTNPRLVDSDGDGISDFDEVTWSEFVRGVPRDPNSRYTPYDPTTNPGGTDLNPLVADTDGDGLLDGQELARGANPLSRDTDGDGVPDGREIALGMRPDLADSDGDGTPDAMEVASGSDPKLASSRPTSKHLLVIDRADPSVGGMCFRYGLAEGVDSLGLNIGVVLETAASPVGPWTAVGGGEVDVPRGTPRSSQLSLTCPGSSPSPLEHKYYRLRWRSKE